MSRPPRRGPNNGRRPQPKRPGAVDIWRVPGPLPEIEPIAVLWPVASTAKEQEPEEEDEDADNDGEG